MNLRSLDDWIGGRDPAIDPCTIEFTCSPATSCRGCLFDRQSSSVCKVAASEAVRRGIPDCDAGVIYVSVEKDSRQLDLLQGSK